MKLEDEIKAFFELYKKNTDFNEYIKTRVILANDEEELYRKRLELTEDETVRSDLIRRKKGYSKAAGCFVMPQINGCYDILLVYKEGKEELCAYNYIHEYQHVMNYDGYTGIVSISNPLAPYKNRKYYLWDEFTARYFSTLVLGEYIKNEVSESAASELLNRICGSLFVYTNKLAETYNGVQFLGAVAACDKLGLSDGILENCSEYELMIMEKYRSIRSVRNVIYS